MEVIGVPEFVLANDIFNGHLDSASCCPFNDEGINIRSHFAGLGIVY